MRRILVLILASSVLIHAVNARGVYQEPPAFIAEAFAGDPPAPQKLWITKELKSTATEILGHAPEALRVSYWRRDGRTVWVLDEIGKEQPITAGFVIENGLVAAVRVLIFRESRGWEIRHPFFTDQFAGIMLDHKNLLNKKIDGISGATLSVNAIAKLTRLALLFHQQVTVGE
jgi:hypothetical protein